MKIVQVGTDIIEIPRIQRAILAHGTRMLNKIFTSGEQAYCLSKTYPYASFAARFAAKEAVAKALGTGIGKELRWKDVNIVQVGMSPTVLVPERILSKFGAATILLSISHCREYATAVAIVTHYARNKNTLEEITSQH